MNSDLASRLQKRDVSTEAKSQHSFLRRALQIRKNGARSTLRPRRHFSMICAGTPRLLGEQRSSYYEIGDDRSVSLSDLPGVWGRQRPMLQSLPATCAATTGGFFMAGSLSTRMKKAPPATCLNLRFNRVGLRSRLRNLWFRTSRRACRRQRLKLEALPPPNPR